MVTVPIPNCNTVVRTVQKHGLGSLGLALLDLMYKRIFPYVLYLPSS